MASELFKAIKTAFSGMHAQASRLRIVSENLANAHSTAQTPGGDPYARKTISFRDVVDAQSGANLVHVAKIGKDKTEFKTEHRPSDPAADEKGYVKLPNVNPLIEVMDLKEAQRSHEANLKVYETVMTMTMRTIELLKV